MTDKLVCGSCRVNEAIGVACVPGVPFSSPYCADCLRHNSHPMYILIANTVCCGGLANTIQQWKDLVAASLKHQEKSLGWFDREVQQLLDKESQTRMGGA